MSSKRRLRRKVCTRKAKHATWGDAVGHITALERKGKVRGYMQPYKCSWCGAWHVGRAKSPAG